MSLITLKSTLEQMADTTASGASWAEWFLGLPWWLGLGSIFIILTLIYLIYDGWKRRTVRILSYQVRSDTPLVSIEEEAELKGRLVITFDSQSVQSLDIRSVVFRLTNSGTEPIPKEDYAGSVKVHFGKDAQVLTATVVDCKPTELGAKADPMGEYAHLQPLLLNKGWSVTIKTLVRGKQDFSVYAPITGVEVKNYTDRAIGRGEERQLILAYTGFIILGISVATGSRIPLDAIGISILLASIVAAVFLSRVHKLLFSRES